MYSSREQPDVKMRIARALGEQVTTKDSLPTSIQITTGLLSTPMPVSLVQQNRI
ncbi:MAG: hypothetical protein WDO15_25580 [Bacteroidota bacterium]